MHARWSKSVKSIQDISWGLVVFLINPKRIIFLAISAFLFTALLVTKFEIGKVTAATGINQTINFQGKVVNSNGTNVADGQYTFVFRLYDVSAGGSHLWTETQTNVQVTAGIFRVALGSTTPISGVDFNTDNIYLGINFNSDGEMTPRIRFASVPYAFNAQKVAGLTVTDTTGTLTIPNSETIQFGGSFTTSAQDLILTLSGSTNVTLPTTGTLATLAGNENLSNKTFTSTVTLSGVSTDFTTGTNESLVISPNGSGNVLVQAGSGGQAAFVIDKTGNGDIFSASTSGTTRFAIDNSGNLTLRNSEQIRNTTDGTITFARNDAGTVTLTSADDDATAALTIQSGGAAALTLDTGGGSTLNLGNTNATSAVLGSSNLGSFTVTTNSTGDSEIILPGQSISSSEILNNTIDYDKVSDNPTLDATTTTSLNTFNMIFDLTSTGELFIRDAGNNFAQFLQDGTITLGKSASASTFNLGIGTGADTISIGTNNTVGDPISIGNNNASTTIDITGGDDWSITTAGAATFSSLSGANLSDCDSSTSKLLWNDATGTFSCGTDQGSNLQVVDFTDTSTEVATFGTAMDVWDGTYPNITPGSTNSEILISVNIYGTSDDAADHNPVFIIRRAIGSDPVCTGGSPSTAVGGEFAGGFLTTASQTWGATVTTSDAPSSTGNVRYTVCTTTSGSDDANTDQIRIVLSELGSSSAGGGGNVSVRETDSSPSIASASTIEFGPTSSSSDEFIVTDEGSGVARIRIGTQVGLLNEAETVTGGWTFDTGNTTFTTSIIANGGLSTTSNGNINLTPNGSGDIVFTSDADTGVSVGSASNTPAPLSVFGGIGSNAAFVLNQLNSGDIIAASAAGTTRFVVDNSGNVSASGNVTLSTGNLSFTSTGGIVLAGGTLLDNNDEVDINDDLSVNGNITLTGTTGLTFTGSGADLIFTNSETIDNDTNGTLTFGRNDTGTVTLTAKDNDATAALTIQSGGAEALTLDTGGNSTLGVGTANATTINIGNTTSATTINLTKGASGNIVLTGFNCSTFTNGGTLTTDSSGNINCENDDGGAATATYWDGSSGAIFPNNETYDVLIGGTATTSAKFAFINSVNGTPTASVSAASGNSLMVNANGQIQTTKAQSLTLGGGDSGEVYTASLLRIDSTLGIRGGGLSDCDNPSTAKLLWDSSTNRFSCGTDQGGGEGSSMTVRESDSSPAVSAVAVLEFGPGSVSADEFIVTDEGSGIARVRIGNQVGLLNEAETVSGGWTFNTGNTTFTTAVNLNGGLTTTTSDQNLAFSANGTGDFVFTIDSGTNMQLSGGADGTDAFVVSAGDVLLSDGDFDLSGGDFNVTLDAGDTFNIAKSAASAGDVFNLATSSVNSIDGLQIDLTSTSDSGADTYNGLNITWTESSDADIVNAINIPNTTSTNSTATGIVVGTGWDTGILVNSGGVSVVAGGLTIAAGNLAVNSDSITSDGSTLTIDAGGTVSIADNLTVTGTSGLTLSGSGADLIFANSESIDNDTNGTITFGRNDAGIVLLTSKDNDATAALTIQSGGAAALTLDAGGAAGVNIGNTNASSISLGNTTSGTVVTINTGSGGLEIGDSANTKAIEIGGVDSNGADTVRIATNATSADSITIGNSNTSTTMALTGGDDWSITSGGGATFTSFDGAGLSGDCDTATTSKVLWDTTTNTFSCGTDYSAPPSIKRNSSSSTVAIGNGSETSILSVSITPSSSDSEIYVMAVLNIDSNTSQDRIVTQRVRRTACTTGTQVGVDVLNFTTNTTEYGVATQVGTDTPATTSSTDYHLCASANGTSMDAVAASITVMEVNIGADLAELYNTNDPTLSVGDVVELDPYLHAGVRKSKKAYGRVLGIVSTQPALLIGGGDKQGVNSVPVALSGRVPVKVSTENGVINPGDQLSASSIPGVAMKATKSGNIIAEAMEGFSSDGIGSILVFVKNSFYEGDNLAPYVDGLVDLSKDKYQKKHDDLKALAFTLDKNSTPSSTLTTDILVAGTKIISDSVSSGEINTDTISGLSGDGLIFDLGKDGTLIFTSDDQKEIFTFDNKGNATFKGTLTVDNIATNKINGLEILVSDMIATSSATLSIEDQIGSLKIEQENLSGSLASISAQLEKFGTSGLLDGENSNDAFLTSIENLTVLGTTTLTDISVTESLTIGTSFKLGESSIETIGSDLSIQSLKQGAIDFLAGSIMFETNGKAIFEEDVEFRKNVSVSGVLSAQSVNIRDLLLGSGDITTISDDEVDATAAAGLVTLKKEKNKVKVNNPLVRDSSYIFITPKSNTSRTLFLRDQQGAKDNNKAFFEVGIDREYSEDIKFNFLIVN